MGFRQLGQTPTPLVVFLSEAERARMRHSWQKMCPVSVNIVPTQEVDDIPQWATEAFVYDSIHMMQDIAPILVRRIAVSAESSRSFELLSSVVALSSSGPYCFSDMSPLLSLLLFLFTPLPGTSDAETDSVRSTTSGMLLCVCNRVRGILCIRSPILERCTIHNSANRSQAFLQPNGT